MRLAIFVLCLNIYCAATLGDNILTRIHHQRDRLADAFHNWFRNTKTVIAFESLGKILLNSGGINKNIEGQFSLVDLKTLKFDPDRKDWGFRIGNWYYIHKNSKVATVNSVEWNDDRSKESEVGFEDFSGQNGSQREVGQASSSPLEPDGVSILAVKSPNGDAKSKTDNKANNVSGNEFSVEVLNPNESK
ncbi:uncharacterized protein LOC127281551 [Leptopilina boulardi]|uniref:uncharacterized protein LOC127281551 n=1 Tax=Leptopilina boulardi TaxID=63433 RepID=UPI0021F62E8E|nr:uncharacterized protein LOC127281551 [Leptopilina boulardi]